MPRTSSGAGFALPGFTLPGLGADASASLLEQLVNDARTTLLTVLHDTDTTIEPTDGSKWPTEGQFRVRAILDPRDADSPSELMLVAGGAGPTYAILERGTEGTTAINHPSGSALRIVLTAGALEQWIIDKGYTTSSFLAASIAAAIDALPVSLIGTSQEGRFAVGGVSGVEPSQQLQIVDGTLASVGTALSDNLVQCSSFLQDVGGPLPSDAWAGVGSGARWVPQGGGGVRFTIGNSGSSTMIQELPTVQKGDLLRVVINFSREVPWADSDHTITVDVASGPTLYLDDTVASSGQITYTTRTRTINDVAYVTITAGPSYEGVVASVQVSRLPAIHVFEPSEDGVTTPFNGKKAWVDGAGRGYFDQMVIADHQWSLDAWGRLQLVALDSVNAPLNYTSLVPLMRQSDTGGMTFPQGIRYEDRSYDEVVQYFPIGVTALIIDATTDVIGAFLTSGGGHYKVLALTLLDSSGQKRVRVLAALNDGTAAYRNLIGASETRSIGYKQLVANGDLSFSNHRYWSGGSVGGPAATNWTLISGGTIAHTPGSTDPLLQSSVQGTTGIVPGDAYYVEVEHTATAGTLTVEITGIGDTPSPVTFDFSVAHSRQMVVAPTGNNTWSGLELTPSSDYDGTVSRVFVYPAELPSLRLQYTGRDMADAQTTPVEVALNMRDEDGQLWTELSTPGPVRVEQLTVFDGGAGYNGAGFASLPASPTQFEHRIVEDSPVFGPAETISAGGGANVVMAVWDASRSRWAVAYPIYID